MGLLMDLPKENNALHHDFLAAYWAIENISFSSDGPDASVMVSFLLHAYPDREAKQKTNALAIVEPFRDFGESLGQTVAARLYRWAGLFPAVMIFTSGIPISRDAQLEILYPFVKSYLDLSDALDVLEESDE